MGRMQVVIGLAVRLLSPRNRHKDSPPEKPGTLDKALHWGLDFIKVLEPVVAVSRSFPPPSFL